MSRTDSADDTTTRFENDVELAAATEGDRIAPELVPRSPAIDVGESVSRHTQTRDPTEADDRTYSVRLVVSRSDSYDDVQDALVYDPDSELFARLSGHTSSGAWSQQERDWKVRDIGADVEVVEASDIDIPDLDGESPEEYVAEWMEILFDNAAYGDDISEEIESFDGKTLTLRDYDNRRADVEYTLVDDE